MKVQYIFKGRRRCAKQKLSIKHGQVHLTGKKFQEEQDTYSAKRGQ